MAREFTYSLAEEGREIARNRQTIPAIAMMMLTIEEQASFLDMHPAWSPLLDEQAVVAGFQGPSGVAFPLECIASFLSGDNLQPTSVRPVAG